MNFLGPTITLSSVSEVCGEILVDVRANGRTDPFAQTQASRVEWGEESR
jgi:hypothetical protein